MVCSVTLTVAALGAAALGRSWQTLACHAVGSCIMTCTRSLNQRKAFDAGINRLMVAVLPHLTGADTSLPGTGHICRTLLTGTCFPAARFIEALQVVLAKSMQPASAHQILPCSGDHTNLNMSRRTYGVITAFG